MSTVAEVRLWGRTVGAVLKNIAFLMDRTGVWSLAPAFDVTWAHNPSGAWTARHQMSMNGKRDDFAMEDFRRCARTASMKRGRAEAIAAVARWPRLAEHVGVPRAWREQIGETLRLTL